MLGAAFSLCWLSGLVDLLSLAFEGPDIKIYFGKKFFFFTFVLELLSDDEVVFFWRFGFFRLSPPGLYAFFFHGYGPIHLVQLEVETTRVAHGTSVRTAAPQSCLDSPAIGASVQSFFEAFVHEAFGAGSTASTAILVSPVVNTARIAQIKPSAVAAPKRRLQIATVGALFVYVRIDGSVVARQTRVELVALGLGLEAGAHGVHVIDRAGRRGHHLVSYGRHGRRGQRRCGRVEARRLVVQVHGLVWPCVHPVWHIGHVVFLQLVVLVLVAHFSLEIRLSLHRLVAHWLHHWICVLLLAHAALPQLTLCLSDRYLISKMMAVRSQLFKLPICLYSSERSNKKNANKIEWYSKLSKNSSRREQTKIKRFNCALGLHTLVESVGRKQT
ncbi:hypothetical protein BpHYR1_002925 [Brachionus plicatilis]|uniref:Uncharacterized protein n=1 Tax=Brachionus plicatilis TaxID=10195 RepID=A0A3M7RBM7_BRAPC|nr:hypothetical protein BpHYR1_002925 [Brachionus plicatilis]